MTKHSGSRIAKGLGAEVVLSGDKGPVIVSGGSAMQLGFSAADGKAAITLSDKDGHSTTVAEGEAREIARAYDDMCSELTRPRQAFDWKSLAAGALAAAVVFAAFPQAFAPKASDVPAAAAPSASQMPLQMPDLMPALEALKDRVDAAGGMRRPTAEGELAELPAPGENALGAQEALPAPILDRPDFLKVPDVLPEIPVMIPETAPVAAEVGEGLGLPAYSAEIYETPPVETEVLQAVEPPAAAAATPVPEAPDEETGTKAASPTVPAAEPPAAPAPVSPAAGSGAETGDAAAEASPVDGIEEEAEAAPSESIAEQAREAARGLVANGLTPDKALDVLQQLEALGQADFTQVTPEMLAQLPHEIAHMLIEKGLAGQDGGMDDAPDGIQYSIIRLSEETMEKYRGEDGIASIPGRNTWASTGNFVSIPLPGGGDIKKPDDMLEFGLQP